MQVCITMRSNERSADQNVAGQYEPALSALRFARSGLVRWVIRHARLPAGEPLLDNIYNKGNGLTVNPPKPTYYSPKGYFPFE